MNKSSVKQFSLPNKLKVFVVENHKAPVVTLQAWVRTGSADEVKGQEGLSHFIEHLLFKGTKKYKVGEIAQVIEASGGELNAYTSFDQTVFYMTLSSEYVETALDALSEMVGRPLFDRIEVDNEREVVIEEIKRSNDSPSRKSSYMLFSSLYQKHPYQRPVIGFDSVVKKTPVPKIVDLFRSRYCPENMFLIIAGDIKVDQIKPKIKNYFSDLKGKLKKVKRPKDEKLNGPVLKIEKSEFKESFVNLAFKTLGASEREMVALELLSYILSQGETSRLIQQLRIKNQHVNDFGASLFQGKDPGFFTFTAYLDPKNILRTLEEITTEILFLAVEPPTLEEIEKNIQHIESHDDYQETIDSDARKIGHYEFMYNNPNYHETYLKILKSIKPNELTDVVRKFFKPENMALTLLTPNQAHLNEWVKDYENSFNDILKLPAARSSSDKKNMLSKVYKSHPHKEPKIIEKNGSRVVFYPIENTKVVSCRFGFLGGLRADPSSKPGVCEMISKTWASGTPLLTEQQIAESIESFSSALSPFSGRNSLGINLMTLSYQQKNIISTFKDVLLNPTFPEFPFSREKSIMLNHIKNLDDHPSHLVFMDFMSCLFKGHPYQNETFGTIDTLQTLKEEDLHSVYKQLVNKQNMTCVIAGDYDAKFWEDEIDVIISQMNSGKKFDKSFSHDSVNHEQKTFKALKKEQSHIVYGFKGLTLHDDRKYALNVMQSILSGQGGRLFLNLRDKASLAYSVSPVRMDGLDTGYFGAYIGCSPDKGEKAIQMMKVEFERLMNELVSKDELQRAQKYLIGKNDISMQKTSNVSSNILFDVLYGHPIPTVKEYKEKTYAVTSQEVQQLAQKIFSGAPVISCVGPTMPWSL